MRILISVAALIIVTAAGLSMAWAPAPPDSQKQEAIEAGFSKKEAAQVAASEYALEKAKPIEAGPVPVAAYVPPPAKTTRAETGATTTVRKVWAYRVVDVSKVPHDYLLIDGGKVRCAIRDGVREIAGLEIYQDEQVSGR